MRAGRKIHPVALLKPVDDKNKVGDKLIVYQSEVECFSAIESGGRAGGRKYKDDQDTVFGRVLFVFDFYPEFKANWRIKHLETGEVYKVLRLHNPATRNIELQAECQAVDD